VREFISVNSNLVYVAISPTIHEPQTHVVLHNPIYLYSIHVSVCVVNSATVW